MTLQEMQKEIHEWVTTYGVRYFSELTNTAILSEEVGEVCRLMARMYGDQSFKDPSENERAHEMLEEEISDVLWVLCCLANQTGIDMTKAFKKNLAKKTTRDQYRHINNPKLK